MTLILCPNVRQFIQNRVSLPHFDITPTERLSIPEMGWCQAQLSDRKLEKFPAFRGNRSCSFHKTYVVETLSYLKMPQFQPITPWIREA